MRSLRATSVYFVCALLLTIVAASCTKKAAKLDLNSSKVMSSLPLDSVGLLYWNTEVASYKKFKQSRWATSQIPVEALEQAELKTTFQVLNRIGLLNAGSTNIESIREGVLFLITGAPDSESSKLNLGIYAEGKSGTDLGEYIGKARAELSKEGIVVKDVSNSARQGISIQLTSKLPIYPDHFIITAKGSSFAAATNTDLVDRYYAPPPQDPKSAPILETTEFKAVRDGADSFLLGALQLDKILPVLDALAPPNQQGPSIDTLPLKMVTFRRGFNETLNDEVKVSFAPKTPEESEALSSFSNSNGLALLKNTPEEALATLQVDGKTFSKLASAAQPGDVIQSTFASIKRIAITAKGGATGGLFPELTLLVESDSPAELSKTITEQIKASATTSGLPFSPWKEIDVQGVKVNYSLTPLGVGLYVGNINNFIAVASTEDGIRRIVELGKSGRSLFQAIDGTDAEEILSRDSVASGYLNFVKLSDTIRELQGTLAMFSGGATNDGEQLIAKLKALGQMSFTTTFGKVEETGAPQLLILASYI